MFNIRDLSVLAYANGFTLWHYKAGPLHLGRVSASNFFNAASDQMKAGDMVVISARFGARVLVVAAVNWGYVVMAPLS
jgi:hypothetical protein